MTVRVTAAEIQKNFEEWHERASREPVEITADGRDTAYLISAETFRSLWASYRRAVRVEDLTDEEMALISQSDIAPENRYELDDDGRPIFPTGPQR